MDGANYQYDVAKDITVFFLAASVLNKGQKTSIIRWTIEYSFGADLEYPDMPHLTDSYTLNMADCDFHFTNDDLLTVVCRRQPVDKGTVLDGRLLFTLPRDRGEQQSSGLVKVAVSCFDYLGRASKQTFIPSSIPLRTIHKISHETIVPRKPDKS